MNRFLLAFAVGAVGCAEWSVGLELDDEAPMPVEIGDSVRMPVGIVVTVLAVAFKNGEEWPGTVDLVVDNPDVLDVSAVAGDTGWGLVATGEGETWIDATVDGHEAPPIPVEVIAQPPSR